MAEPSTAPSTPAAQAAANRLAGLRPPVAAPAPVAPVAAPASVEKAKKGKKKKEKAEAGEENKKKKPTKLILIVVLVLVVGYVAKGKIMKPHYGPGNPVPSGAIFDFPSAITTNLPDGSLAQISMSVQLTKVGSAKIMTKDTSELVGTAVQIIGADNYATLLSTPGRIALKAALVKAFDAELGPTEGAQQVSAVYFTSYVLQQG